MKVQPQTNRIIWILVHFENIYQWLKFGYLWISLKTCVLVKANQSWTTLVMIRVPPIISHQPYDYQIQIISFKRYFGSFLPRLFFLVNDDVIDNRFRLVTSGLDCKRRCWQNGLEINVTFDQTILGILWRHHNHLFDYPTFTSGLSVAALCILPVCIWKYTMMETF